MDGIAEQFYAKGWAKFAYDPKIADWVAKTAPAAHACAADPQLRADWLRCNGTWFVGVNCLPNDRAGAVGESGTLRGQVIDFIHETITSEHVNWDQAQVSVCYRGYPKPSDQESEAAHRFRLKRDAAHVDGLLRAGADGGRKLQEFHCFLLGIPITHNPAGAAPFVIWEGSHEIIRAAFTRAFEGHSPEDWCDLNVADIYKQTRRKIFDTCRRVELAARPGEAYVVHRMALHGMAPWPDTLEGPDEGRMIAYFRPTSDMSPRNWLDVP